MQVEQCIVIAVDCDIGTLMHGSAIINAQGVGRG